MKGSYLDRAKLNSETKSIKTFSPNICRYLSNIHGYLWENEMRKMRLQDIKGNLWCKVSHRALVLTMRKNILPWWIQLHFGV